MGRRGRILEKLDIRNMNLTVISPISDCTCKRNRDSGQDADSKANDDSKAPDDSTETKEPSSVRKTNRPSGTRLILFAVSANLLAGVLLRDLSGLSLIQVAFFGAIAYLTRPSLG